MSFGKQLQCAKHSTPPRMKKLWKGNFILYITDLKCFAFLQCQMVMYCCNVYPYYPDFLTCVVRPLASVHVLTESNFYSCKCCFKTITVKHHNGLTYQCFNVVIAHALMAGGVWFWSPASLVGIGSDLYDKKKNIFSLRLTPSLFSRLIPVWFAPIKTFVILLPNVFAAETMWVPVLEGLILLYINSWNCVCGAIWNHG